MAPISLRLFRMAPISRGAQLREKSQKKQEIWPEAKKNYIKGNRKKERAMKRLRMETGRVWWS